MRTMRARVTRRSEIPKEVAHVERQLAPDVVHIRYEIGTDWSGDSAIYFRVVLSDDAGENRLRNVVKRVESLVCERFDFEMLGLFPYHNFRSESEQAALREEAWA